MTRKNPTLRSAKRVLKYLRAYTFPFIISLIFAAGYVVLSLLIPKITGRAIDLITDGQTDIDGLVSLCVRALVMIGAAALCQWICNLCNNRITFGIVRRLRRDAFNKIQSLPLSYLDANPIGDTVSRVISDADQVSDGLLLGFSQFFTGVLTILGTLVLLFSIEWRIALIVIILTPMSLFVAYFIAKKIHVLFKTQAQVKAEQTSLTNEMLGNHKTVVAFSHGDEALRDFDGINTKLEKCSRKAVFFSSLTNPSTRFVNNLVYAAVVLSGSLFCISTGNIATAFSVGDLSCMLSYASQYMKPFNEISGVVTELQNALTCADRLFDLIYAQPETPDKNGSAILNPETVVGNIDIKHVDFSYTPERELINDFNLSVKGGQRVAIVGPTGCGKTTLINLLMRFYDVKEGEICVDGNVATDITRKSLRECYGMVLQETWLKPGTVKENIALGKPNASDEEIRTAAKAAHADSFIRRLPNGYDTVIGEDGGSLSQGQKQLLCISRLFLCPHPMLILDEATSSIDTRTELKIQSAFALLMKGRTSFIVAHRLSTIKEADVILVMDKGSIIESGKHGELLEKGGFYAKLYNSQFEN